MMTYQETIDFLFEQLPMYQNMGKVAIKKDLANIHKLCSILGNPHLAFPVIHVAGTNGKGTTSHIISSILQESGFKVGLYTSPHYIDFRERIKINGDLIPFENVIEFVQSIKKEIKSFTPSFFEITVAMAFEYFREERIDVAVIETGLGGRLDSTNIVKPEISVITNIGLDHQDILGPTPYEIAKEKAGIIKAGKPVVIGKYQESCDHIFLRESKSTASSITFASLEWEVVTEKNQTSIKHIQTGHEIQLGHHEFAPFEVENMITALETVRSLNQLGHFKITTTHMSSGLCQYRGNSNYIGRWTVLNELPKVIADSAHNLDALKVVIEHLHSGHSGTIHFILGFVKGKKIEQILKLLNRNQKFYFTQPSIFRGLPTKELSRIANSSGIQGRSFDDVDSALKYVLSTADLEDIVYVGGSSFIVADVLACKDNHFKN